MTLNCYKLTPGVKTVARFALSKLTVARRVLQTNSLYNLYERISNMRSFEVLVYIIET